MELPRPPVFLSYAKPDLERARGVYRWLTRGGVRVWMDEIQLRAGQDWELEIRKAIRGSNIFIACLSKNSVDRQGFFQTELRLAYRVWETMPAGRPYLIPLRLDDCEVPPQLEKAHYLDYFADNGPEKLLSDVYSYVAPQTPALRLGEALQDIYMGRLESALEKLVELKALADDRDPDLRLRVLLDLACVESLSAGALPAGSEGRSAALGRAVGYLRELFDYGTSGAWATTGRTAGNEVFRIGSDADLLAVLSERRAEVVQALGALAVHLPPNPPYRTWGRGSACVVLTGPVATRRGFVPFESLRPGDAILSAPYGGGTIETRVVRLYASRTHECVVLNGGVPLSASQPLYDASNLRMRAGDVEVGTLLRGAAGGTVTVGSIDRLRGHFEIGTLTTDHPSHNFLCGGLVCGNFPHKKP